MITTGRDFGLAECLNKTHHLPITHGSPYYELLIDPRHLRVLTKVVL